jgi:peroxiredoxin
MKTKDLTIAIFAVALVAVMAYVWLAPAGMNRAPDVRMTTLDGRTLQLSELSGQPVLVTFWATTCPSCVHEIPYLNALHEELGPRGLEVIGIAMDYDPPAQVTEMVRTRDIRYTIALDSTGEAAKAFGDVRLTPTSFLIAPDGRIVHQKIGDLDMPWVRGRIEGMLASRVASSDAR